MQLGPPFVPDRLAVRPEAELPRLGVWLGLCDGAAGSRREVGGWAAGSAPDSQGSAGRREKQARTDGEFQKQKHKRGFGSSQWGV